MVASVREKDSRTAHRIHRRLCLPPARMRLLTTPEGLGVVPAL